MAVTSENEEHAPETASSDQEQQKAGTPKIPEEYRGKSAEDLAGILVEKEKFIQQRNQEVGDLRKRNDDLDAIKNEMAYLRENLGRRTPDWAGGQDIYAQRQAAQPEEDALSDTDILASPKQAVNRLLDARLKKIEEVQQQRDAVRFRVESESAFLEGQALFAKQHPELYKGIERDVSNVIFAAQQRGAITPFDARNPETWKTSAEWIHLKRGNKELLLGKTPPVKAVETQKPSRVRPDEDEDEDVELDLTDMELHKVMKQFGIKSVEKAKEIIKAEQKRVRSGENIPRARRT